MEHEMIYARKRTIEANNLRKKHHSRWKRRIVTGLGTIALLGAIGTNRKLYRETGAEEILGTLEDTGVPTWVFGGSRAGLYGSVVFNNQAYSFSATPSNAPGKTVDTSIAHLTVLDCPTGPGYRVIAQESF